MVEGLHKTLELIDRKTRSIKPDYIIELKQNYATPHLMNYGTLVRAGDTPYDPRGNFLRTAYIHAYTPYTLNDYQSITNSDTPAQAAAMVIRMMAVGVPSYSMDLPALRESHKRILRFFHEWLERNPQWNHCRRQAEGAEAAPPERSSRPDTVDVYRPQGRGENGSPSPHCARRPC